MTAAPQLSRHVLQALAHDPVRSSMSDAVAEAAMSLNGVSQMLNETITTPQARVALARHIRRLASSIEKGGGA